MLDTVVSYALWPLQSVAGSIAVFVVLAWALPTLWCKITGPGFKVKGKHVFVTGGSTGLGLATAKLYAKAGALVTIVSRSQSNLEGAKAEILKAVPDAQVFVRACDVMSEAEIKKTIAEAAAFHKRGVDHLICSAGLSTPGYFLTSTVDQHRAQMNLNYFGVVNTVHAALPDMVARKEGGTVVLVSSAVCFCGMVGYSLYAPSKYALRGLADCLRNELAGTGVRVVGFYPSSMDTPSFAEEQKIKPVETAEIEGTINMFSADTAAKHLVDGLAAGHYSITNETLAELGRMMTTGPVPRNNTLFELILSPLGVLIGFGYGLFMDFVVRKHANLKKKAQ